MGFGQGKLDQWTLLARARAMDTTGYVAAVDQAYPGDDVAAVGPTGVGGSVVASPLGEVVAAPGADQQCWWPTSTSTAVERLARPSRCSATGRSSVRR